MEDMNKKKVLQPNDFILTSYNDMKGNWQSYEVGINTLAELNEAYSDGNTPDITGYGKDDIEAVNNFIERFEEYYQRITEFHDRLKDDVVAYIEVDYSGKKIMTDKTRAVKLLDKGEKE